MYDVVTEKLFARGKALRSLPSKEKTLFLTFDDGPSEFTKDVLLVLEQLGAQATFFLVAQNAQARPSLVHQMVEHGHAIGNHSLDHSYGKFFARTPEIRQWIEASEEVLAQISGQPTVGFRPPAGVITPHLMEALRELQQPLILWNRRFFDTLKTWQESSAMSALSKIAEGDIILLHDRQPLSRRQQFLQTLRQFIEEAQRRGYAFGKLKVNIDPRG